MDARERKLRTARLLRAGLVTTGVAGSLGLAGLVGWPALHSATTGQAPSGPAGTQTQQPAQQTQLQPRYTGDDGEGEGGDDGYSFPSAPRVNQPGPTLQQGGGGAPHGTTAGS